MPLPDCVEPYHLLFVCSGNICRSPMAEALAVAYARRRDRCIEIRSAGTLMIEGAPADPHATAVCAEIGVDLAGHESQGLTASLIGWADYVLVMELQHAAMIRERFPEVGEKLLLLGTFSGSMEIADQIGSTKYRFRASRDELRRAVELLIDRLPPRGEG